MRFERLSAKPLDAVGSIAEHAQRGSLVGYSITHRPRRNCESAGAFSSPGKSARKPTARHRGITFTAHASRGLLVTTAPNSADQADTAPSLPRLARAMIFSAVGSWSAAQLIGKRWALMSEEASVSAAEGLIRTYELLEELKADVMQAYETLETDRESQYLRRCVVRSVFSFIEACVEVVKCEIRSAFRTRSVSVELTERERETLGSIAIWGDRATGKFLPLDQNVKRTFRLAAKVWGLRSFKLDTGGEDFADFRRAKNARNALTHPRTYYDIQVSDDDMHCHTIAYFWTAREFARLFHDRVEHLAESLSRRERVHLLEHTGMAETEFSEQ